MKQDYLAYKKKKLGEFQENEIPSVKGPETRLRKMMPVIIAGFVVCFVLAIIIIANCGSKVDIEYGKLSNDIEESYDLNDDSIVSGEVSGKHNIDSRLKTLHAEETNPSLIDRFKKKEKDKSEDLKIEDNDEIKDENKLNEPPKIVYSKVLLGRYSTIEEAKSAQEKLRTASGIQAFPRKMGNVYALQVGSYLNPEQAKQVAIKFSNMDYQVWILED